MAGCSRPAGNGENLFQIPWQDDGGGYRLQKVAIRGFDEPHALQGRFARIFVNPFTKDGRLESETAFGRFVRNKDGVAIPADYATLQATAVHAHFDRLNALDSALNIAIDWPMKIGIRASVRDRYGAIQNNAIFDSRLDALLLVPYSGDNLPIALNGGILAHEHFHMIFQSLVMSRVSFKRKERLGLSKGASEWAALIEKGNRGNPAIHEIGSRSRIENNEFSEEIDSASYASLFNEFHLRALNEGLADFWAWVYTGDDDFIAHSLPSESRARRLDLRQSQFETREETKSRVFRVNGNGKPFHELYLASQAYYVGTMYARVLRELTVTSSEDRGRSRETRMRAAKAVLASLPELVAAVSVSEAGGSYVSGAVFLKPLYRNWPDNEGVACEIFQRVMPNEPGLRDAMTCPKRKGGKDPEPAPTPIQIPPGKITQPMGVEE